MKESLSVAEIFYSIQGEGPSIGRPSIFIRLAGCNLMCGGHGTELDKLLHGGATWRCDTIETWRHGKNMSFEAIANEMVQLNKSPVPPHIILTGGEPTLQDEGIREFLNRMNSHHTYYVEMETNGTVIPIRSAHFIDQFNVSPKLKNSGTPPEERYIPDSLQWFRDDKRTVWKFVVSGLPDWDEILEDFIEPLKIYRERIWLMPAVSTRQDLAEVSADLVELCKEEGVNFSTRLHLTIWDQTVGV